MSRLVLLQGGEVTPYSIKEGRTLIGRHPECEIQLDSTKLSRKHAAIERSGESFILEDLGSGNGSFINGKRVETPTALSNGDRVRLGPIRFRFEGKEEPEKPQVGFDLDLVGGDDDVATIMGEYGNVMGYGALDVRPEEKLKAVLEISRSLAGTLDLKTMLPRIMDALLNIFPKADRGCILLKNPTTGDMYPAIQKHRREEEDSTVRLSRTILKHVFEDKKGILSADATSDARFETSESISDLTIHSMMCVPLLGLEGDVLGVINLDTQNPINHFKEEDLDLLVAVAGQTALSYESAELLASHVEKKKQDGEMRIASEVQQALLPEQFPEVDGYDFYASYDAAQAVGGDYYDSFILEDGKICLSFGDVAGKGVPGALIMSRMASVVRSTMAFTSNVGEAIEAINNHMCDNAVEGRFVTYVLVVLDPSTHEISLVNAGHMSPLIRKVDGTVDEFPDETIGVPVGVVSDYPYDVVTRVIEPGEVVVIVTDGVDEAMNPKGELYTKERVVDFVKNGPAIAEDMGQTLLSDVRRHADGRPQNDDITIMTFSRNAN